jgi:hypothetical protein
MSRVSVDQRVWHDASPRREVEANLLRGAASRGAQARADPQDAGGQDLGDLVEALRGSHEVGIQGHEEVLIRCAG